MWRKMESDITGAAPNIDDTQVLAQRQGVSDSLCVPQRVRRLHERVPGRRHGLEVREAATTHRRQLVLRRTQRVELAQRHRLVEDLLIRLKETGTVQSRVLGAELPARARQLRSDHALRRS